MIYEKSPLNTTITSISSPPHSGILLSLLSSLSPKESAHDLMLTDSTALISVSRSYFINFCRPGAEENTSSVSSWVWGQADCLMLCCQTELRVRVCLFLRWSWSCCFFLCFTANRPPAFHFWDTPAVNLTFLKHSICWVSPSVNPTLCFQDAVNMQPLLKQQQHAAMQTHMSARHD